MSATLLKFSGDPPPLTHGVPPFVMPEPFDFVDIDCGLCLRKEIWIEDFEKLLERLSTPHLSTPSLYQSTWRRKGIREFFGCHSYLMLGRILGDDQRCPLDRGLFSKNISAYFPNQYAQMCFWLEQREPAAWQEYIQQWLAQQATIKRRLAGHIGVLQLFAAFHRRRKLRPFICPECGELLRREDFCKRKRCIYARTIAGWPAGRLWVPDYTIQPEIILPEKWDGLHASWIKQYTRPVVPAKDKKGNTNPDHDPDIRVFKDLSYYDEENRCWTRSYKGCAYWLWSPQAKEYFNQKDRKQKTPRQLTSIMPSGCTEKRDAQEWIDNDDSTTTAPRIDHIPAIFDDDEVHEKDEYSEISLGSAEKLSVCVEENILNQVFQARTDDHGSAPAKSSIGTHVRAYEETEQRPNYDCFSKDPVYVDKYDHPKLGPCERTVTLEKCKGNGGASAPKWTPEKNRGMWMVDLDAPTESVWQRWEDEINIFIAWFQREHPEGTELYEPPPIIRQDREGRLVGQKLSMDRRTTVSKPKKPEELDHLIDLYRRRRDTGTLTNKDEIVLRSYFDSRTNAEKGAEIGKTKEGFRSMSRRYGQPIAGVSEAVQKLLEGEGRGWFFLVKPKNRPAKLIPLDALEHATDDELEASIQRSILAEAVRISAAEIRRAGINKLSTPDGEATNEAKQMMDKTWEAVTKAFKRGHLIGSFDCNPETCALCASRSLTAPAARVREHRKLVKTLIHTFEAELGESPTESDRTCR